MADFGSSIVAYFGGDTTGLNKAIEGAEGMVSKFQKALGAVGLAIGAGAVLSFFKSVVDKYSQIKDMSDALNVSTDAIQSFGYAAKLAGVEVEMTQKMWQTVRKSVDDLAAGTDMAVKQFAALGLAQKDLIGLPLDAALEKIAKAYVDNKDKAGAYAAMIEIAGGRSAKLMGVLEELGVKGAKAFDDIAKASGQVLGERQIKAIDDFGDAWGTAWGFVQKKGADALGFLITGINGVKDGWQMMQRFLGQEKDPFNLEGTYNSAKKVKDVLVETAQTTEAVLKEQKKAAEEAQKAADAQIKATIAEGEAYRKIELDKLTTGKSIALQKLEIHDLEVAINTAGWTGVKLEEEKKVLTERRIALKKEEAQFEKEMLTANEKFGKDQAARQDSTAKFFGVARLSADDLAEKQILEAKRARGLTDEEAAKLKTLELEQQVWQQIVIITGILAVPEKDRTEEGKRQLSLAFQRVDAIKAQIVALAGGALPAEQAITAELQKQLALKQQKAQLDIIGQMSQGGVTQEQVSRASDAELQAMISIKQRQLLDYQIANPGWQTTGSIGQNLGGLSLSNPIAMAQGELAKRSNIRQITETQGMQAGAQAYQQQYGGNALMFEAFYNSIKSNATATDKTNNLLKNLSGQLAASGIFPSAPFGGT